MSRIWEEIGNIVESFKCSVINLSLSVLTLFVILLVFSDLPSNWHSFVAALVVYVLFVGYVTAGEIRLTVAYNTKSDDPSGLPWGWIAFSLLLQLGALAALL